MSGRRQFLASLEAALGVGAVRWAPRTDEGATRSHVPTGWSTRRAMPRGQGNVGSAVLDGRLYAFGGIRSGEHLDTVRRGFAYDPSDGPLGTWEPIPDLPRALWGACGVATEGAVYSFGGAPEDSPHQTGDPPSDAVLEYVPGEGWTDLTEADGVRCPFPTWAMRGVHDPDSGLVYNVGGATFSRADGQGNADRVWTFDPARRAVANPDLARLPEGKRWPTVALVDGGLHVVAGLGSGPSDDHLRYDLATGEWSERTPAPSAGMYATNNDPVVDGDLFLTHGLFWEDDLSEERYELACHRYDPTADEWTTGGLPAPTYRRSAGTADGVIDGVLYVAGGHFKHYSSGGFHEALPYVEAFRPG